MTMATGNSQSSSSEIELKVLIRCIVKGYQDCLFKVETSDIFTTVKKGLWACEVNLDIFKERSFQRFGL